jgi:aromatic ring-opening dioxygenase catalytic subunit (LigB family)
MELAPHALTAHPRTEHLLPLLVSFGAAFPMSSHDNPEKEQRRSRKIFSQTVVGTLSLDSFSFT